MGSTFSYFMSGQTQPDPSLTLPTAERRDPPYLGLGVPEEASHTREDSHGWYTDFFDILRVAVHQDQESLIVFNPKHNRPRIVQLSDEEDEGEDEDEEGAVAAYAELMYKRLFDEPNESESGSNSASSKAGQKRIVRYVHALIANFTFSFLTDSGKKLSWTRLLWISDRASTPRSASTLLTPRANLSLTICTKPAGPRFTRPILPLGPAGPLSPFFLPLQIRISLRFQLRNNVGPLGPLASNNRLPKRRDLLLRRRRKRAETSRSTLRQQAIGGLRLEPRRRVWSRSWDPVRSV